MNARATVRNPEMAALLEQYSARFNARRAEAYAAANAAPEQWTPKAVGETMIEALRWAQWAAGRVGPGGIKTVALPFVVTLDEHLANGWGLPETAGDDEPDPRRLRVMPSPVQVARHEAALDWPPPGNTCATMRAAPASSPCGCAARSPASPSMLP